MNIGLCFVLFLMYPKYIYAFDKTVVVLCICVELNEFNNQKISVRCS